MISNMTANYPLLIGQHAEFSTMLSLV